MKQNSEPFFGKARFLYRAARQLCGKVWHGENGRQVESRLSPGAHAARKECCCRSCGKKALWQKKQGGFQNAVPALAAAIDAKGADGRQAFPLATVRWRLFGIFNIVYT